MSRLKSLWGPLLSVVLAFILTAGLCLALGENPLYVFKILFLGAFGSPTNIGYSLYYATPLIFTGLAVSWAFRLGLFNIGGEGQMALGGTAMVAVAVLLSGFSGWLVWPLALLAAAFVGGTWSGIAGWVKAYRGAHEVLCTILLNFIAYGLVSYLIAFPLKNVESQAPESLTISEGLAWLPIGFGGSSPLNLAFVFALFVALLMWFVSEKTVFGFRQRLVGGAPGTALRTGLNNRVELIKGMFLSGALAGIAGASEIFGYSLKVREGFTSGAGFVGIAVALLGRTHPLGVVLSAILFGALQKGALELDMDTETITRDLAVVIQALIILSVICEKGLKALTEKVQGGRANG